MLACLVGADLVGDGACLDLARCRGIADKVGSHQAVAGWVEASLGGWSRSGWVGSRLSGDPAPDYFGFAGLRLLPAGVFNTAWITWLRSK
jgi:hypothetical protein